MALILLNSFEFVNIYSSFIKSFLVIYTKRMAAFMHFFIFHFLQLRS